MKMKSIITVAITAILVSAGCVREESTDFKLTVVPQAGINAIDTSNLNEAVRIIKWRLINFGISLENVNIATSADRIDLKISKIDTAETGIIENLIIMPGEIGFFETYENGDIISFLSDANTRLKEMNVITDNVISDQPAETRTEDTLSIDELALLDIMENDTTGDASMKRFKAENPLFGILIPMVDNEGQPRPSCLIGIAALTDTAMVNKCLNMDEIKVLFPRDLRFYWSRDPYKWDDSKTLFELHAIKETTYDGQAPLDGSVIASSKPVKAKSGDAMVNISMTSEGAKIWSRMTRDNIDRCIAVILDGYVISYPRVMAEITGGNTQISSGFSLPEAKYLAAILSTGGDNLPLKLQIADKQIIRHQP